VDALISRLSRRQVANNSGVGLSMLNQWVAIDQDKVSVEDCGIERENERLLREIPTP
jgi:hypothetical protein